MKANTKIIFIISLIVCTRSLVYSQEQTGIDIERIAREYVKPNLISAEAVYKRMRELSVMESLNLESNDKEITPSTSSISGTGWLYGYGVPNGIDGGIGPMVFDSAGNLYIGGRFRFAGNVVVNNIAKWNGYEWSALGKGIGGDVNTILPLGGDTLLVGGNFERAGDSTIYFLARWDGNNWSSVCNGLGGRVHNIIRAKNGDMYVSGAFMSHKNIAKWNGTCWTKLGGGANEDVGGIAEFKNYIYVTGHFGEIGGKPSITGFARWDGSAWTGLSNPCGRNSGIFTHDTSLYLIGSGAIYRNQLLGFTNIPVTTSGGGLNCVEFNDSNHMYIGGSYLTVDTLVVNGLAKWDGTRWSGMNAKMETRFMGIERV